MSHSHSGLCPKVNSFAPLLIINGENFYFHDPYGNRLTEDYSEYDPVNPYYNTVNNPAIGYNELSEQLVKSTRNARGQVVSQVINRRLNKFDNLYTAGGNYLYAKRPIWYKDVKCNLIDMGY